MSCTIETHEKMQTKFCVECGQSAEVIQKKLSEKQSKDVLMKLNELYVKFKEEHKEIFAQIDNIINTNKIVCDESEKLRKTAFERMNLYISIYPLTIKYDNILPNIIDVFFKNISNDDMNVLIFKKSISFVDDKFIYHDEFMLQLFNKYKEQYPNVKYDDIGSFYMYFTGSYSGKYYYYLKNNNSENEFINHIAQQDIHAIKQKEVADLLERFNKKLEITDDSEMKHCLEVIRNAVNDNNSYIITQLLKK